ncbi:DGQHR domain-containing protein [Paenibacillus peoriae]|uniref:DGQHR domain-containing protein n=1 Tax=Paenibacillus peoriae TaxID=59893 RepID=UPI00026C6486|nr:DGQHR domain-containing protein [Paenibacillus peoriae]MEC0182602.1 DGQHR domain-containing protein [Paenibacillus peoriae]
MNGNQGVIENVVMGKLRGKVFYQSSFPATLRSQIIYVKPYDMTSGKGYQRPVNVKRAKDFANYLSVGEESLFTPILLNAASNWEFICYDRQRPSFGRLLCKGKASLMDGQHRMDGIDMYVDETSADISIPFMAFHYLDEDEEIKLFDTINTKAKTIGSSLNKYLNRNSDVNSWVATELVIRRDSPFHQIGSIIGKRTKGRHVTLQNLYRIVKLFSSSPKASSLPKEVVLETTLMYYKAIEEMFPKEWNNYNEFRLTHIVVLDAFAMVGSIVLEQAIKDKHKPIDQSVIVKSVKCLSGIDLSSTGPLKYLKGIAGSKSLASDLKSIMISI